ncbi:MAG: hypothetical protein NTZ65_02615 [Candidatus Berkelbacteria bacterium]|nr:hypothetical protein [Candidatus Berkelbacteria bacterium]
MLSIEITKKILGKPDISDEKAEFIRNEVRSLAEIVVGAFIDKEIKPDLKEKFNLDNKGE